MPGLFPTRFAFIPMPIVSTSAEPPAFDRDVAPFLKKHCGACHGAAPKKGTGPVSVDCSGSFPDGRTFANLAEFAEYLMSETPPARYHFGEVLLRQMAAHTLNQPLNLNDAGLIRKLIQASRGDDWRLRSMIRVIVLSRAFTHG
jgi:hypothetical protein